MRALLCFSFGFALCSIAAAQTSGGTAGSPGAAPKEPPAAGSATAPSVFSDSDVARPPGADAVSAARQRSGAPTPANTYGSVSVTPEGKVRNHDVPEPIRKRLQQKQINLGGPAQTERNLGKVDTRVERLGGNETSGASGVRNIVGSDDRRRVGDTTRWPFRTIGQIAIGCTGTLIGRRHVLTAGHCVYDLKAGRWYKDLTFSPGLNGNSAPYGSVGWKTAYAPRGYTERGLTEFDIALIVLDRDIGDQLGWLGVSWFDPFQNYQINIAGYPGDLGGRTNWLATCPIDEYNEGLVAYRCDTAGGMSGSAIYNFRTSGGQERRDILGVHTNGGAEFNFGTRINKDTFNLVKDWLKNR